MFRSFSHKTAHTPRRTRVCACAGWGRGQEGGARCERGGGRGDYKAQRREGAVSGALTGSVGAATNGLWRSAQAGCALSHAAGGAGGAQAEVGAHHAGKGRCVPRTPSARCVGASWGVRGQGKGRGASSAQVGTVHVGCGARSSFCANGNLHGVLCRKKDFGGHDVEFWCRNPKLLFLGSALRAACWKTTLGFGLIDDSRWFACANSLVSGRHRWRPETSFYVSAGRRQY